MNEELKNFQIRKIYRNNFGWQMAAERQIKFLKGKIKRMETKGMLQEAKQCKIRLERCEGKLEDGLQ